MEVSGQQLALLRGRGNGQMNDYGMNDWGWLKGGDFNTDFGKDWEGICTDFSRTHTPTKPLFFLWLKSHRIPDYLMFSTPLEWGIFNTDL